MVPVSPTVPTLQAFAPGPVAFPFPPFAPLIPKPPEPPVPPLPPVLLTCVEPPFAVIDNPPPLMVDEVPAVEAT